MLTCKKKKNFNDHVIPLEYDRHNSNQSHLLITIPFVHSTANQTSLLTVTQTGLLFKICMCGAREVRSPCAWRGGARPGSRVTGGD